MRTSFSNYRHILVLSSPRSGTHLLLNTIKHNLSSDSIFKSWEYFCPVQQGHPIEGGRPASTSYSPDLSGRYLIKSHAKSRGELYDQIKPSSIIDKAALIYVHRDPFEVMRSSYYYYPTWSKRCQDIISSSLKANTNSFREFIAHSGLLEEWVESTKFWLSQKDVFCVSYSDLMANYDQVLCNLSGYLSLPISSNIVRPRDASFNNGVGVVSPGLTKNQFKREEFIDFINLRIKNHKNGP